MKIKILLTALMAWSLTAQAAPQKIEFWTFSMKPKFTPYFETLVHNYEAANPGVKIEWIDFPWDVIQSKLVTRIVAGTPPALVNLNVPWADEFARDGLLTPVDALLADARPRYLASTLEDLTFNGRTYGFPMYSNVAVITYNKDLFKAAGLTHAPRSMDEELDYARRIAASTGQAGLCPALSKIDGLFMQQGLAVITDGKAVFNSPRHVAFIQKLADTYKAGGLLKTACSPKITSPPRSRPTKAAASACCWRHRRPCRASKATPRISTPSPTSRRLPSARPASPTAAGWCTSPCRAASILRCCRPSASSRAT